ncbi:unnamed protein product [Meganyctiphanes norvegica]|uniref:WAP domain-containing protein n=1 Tax=Meganyctiphanes norvegica TaxID=48144 RepID=A0AAV2PHN4_MEGNR
MGSVVYLVVVSMALLVASAAPQSGHHGGCGAWWQPPCPTTRAPPGRYCDTWCEYPRGSGQFKCCDQVPDNNGQLECPKDPRKPGDCNKPAAFGGSAPPPSRCYRNSDCPSGLHCCYDACLGQTCKHPVRSG